MKAKGNVKRGRCGIHGRKLRPKDSTPCTQK